MEPALKQRLWGAAVLVALAVIFLPMLIQGPAPESGVSDVPLDMPNAPAGDYETRELPLVTPGDTPNGGALGMQAQPGDRTSGAISEAAISEAIPLGADSASSAAALPADPAGSTDDNLHAAVAGGDYAVSFGSYATAANAQAVVRALQQSQLPGFQEAATANGRTAYRVRIGPYATRAAAESARLRAAHVRDDVNAAVVVLDADTATPSASKPVATPAAAVVSTQPLPQEPPKPAAATPTVATPVAPKPAEAAKPVAQTVATPAAANVGFAVQLGAFSKATDANALRDRVRAAGMSAFTEEVKTDKGMLTRVRVGPVASRADADQLKAQVRAKIGVDGIVRPHP
ncbi:MAG: SPOR domain-containing protein [Lysobacter sp.]|nr:SPOR domain-containing protein [Lysobacter sp.]